MLKIFASLSVHELKDSTFVFVMSHGDEKGFVTRDGELIEKEYVCDVLNNKNSKPLLGKPKIIVFQTCRYFIFYSIIPTLRFKLWYIMEILFFSLVEMRLTMVWKTLHPHWTVY